MRYLATFALENKVRDNVKESIQMIRFGKLIENEEETKGEMNQVNVRLISGDHVDTALYIAKEVGIINEQEMNLEGVYMTGDVFRKSIGEYSITYDHATKSSKVIFD